MVQDVVGKGFGKDMAKFLEKHWKDFMLLILALFGGACIILAILFSISKPIICCGHNRHH